MLICILFQCLEEREANRLFLQSGSQWRKADWSRTPHSAAHNSLQGSDLKSVIILTGSIGMNLKEQD